MVNSYTLHAGNSAEILKQYPDNHFDCVVTDPPYGIDFLGKSWDNNTGDSNVYAECLRVLKPGGHLLAFSAARTYHHLATTVERAGFEIRDQIMWIYSSGFPKSQDIGRQIQKKLGVKETEILSGGGGYLQDNCPGDNKDTTSRLKTFESIKITDDLAKDWSGWGTNLKPAHEPIVMARKPLSEKNIKENCLKWNTGAINIDATRIQADDGEPRFTANVIGEITEYQKFFYCPKISRAERHMGFDLSKVPTDPAGMLENGHYTANKQEFSKNSGNNHPTVKPQALMEYLIKLVAAPNSIVLDPFNGSGSTGMAAVKLGHQYVGIDLDPQYIEISERRIRAWNDMDTHFCSIFEVK
jgi:DNA modification methylase